MTFQEFITAFDVEGSVVLLEGKRNVLTMDAPYLTALGSLLAKSTHLMHFRSGNAPGADAFFTAGVASISPERIQLILPYSKHRQEQAQNFQRYSLEDIPLLEEPALIYETKKNKKMANLVDRYAQGNRDPYAMKAAYILRDTVKVMGSKNLRPIRAGIFYDDLNHPNQGGTGHTMNVCKNQKIPIFTQEIWGNWLK
ncbi:MAG: hypothetical protein FJZ80_07370 [Bacteroidetes bacterium]|nr:hypothetical protein [Bacteroidota bacterium]MBM3424503.1 hypothetical protein [Bacteroidota bacterium]